LDLAATKNLTVTEARAEMEAAEAELRQFRLQKHRLTPEAEAWAKHLSEEALAAKWLLEEIERREAQETEAADVSACHGTEK
jgi:hypothetical protein